MFDRPAFVRTNRPAPVPGRAPNRNPIPGHTTNRPFTSQSYGNKPGTHRPSGTVSFHKATPRAPIQQLVKQAPKVHREATGSANLVRKQEITINESITVKEFSEKM